MPRKPSITTDTTLWAVRRGPDTLPRRLTPKTFDELHTLVHPLETQRPYYNRHGWDREHKLADDAKEHAGNRVALRRRYQGSVPSSALGFRHSGWAKDRRRLTEALCAAYPGKPVVRRFMDCGSKVIVCRDKANPEHYTLVGNYCRNRWCVPCGNARSQQLARLWRPHFEGKTVRFITLTLARDGLGLEGRLNRLYACFRRLQRSKLWTDSVTGAVAFLEVKRSSRSASWHPHFHVIASGTYLPQKALATLWHRITGDSYVVDIRAVRDTQEVTTYVTKYATKPGHKTFIGDLALTVEAIKALHGRRLMIRYGEYREFKLKEPGEPREYEPVMSLKELLRGVGENRCTHLAIFRRVLGLPAQPDPWQGT